MTEKREVPEADRLDQLTPIDQSVAVEAFEHRDTAPALVNEADWIDQQIPVPVDDPEQEAQ
ncbi:hypothetical protein ACFPZL_04940 [Leucobacter soli]|uniref:hypothetical protein n=1 Tax=Leucobacter soli TaxID=2812850 RepID=UPI001C4044D3|nr:hypothetical protein [Leucobacter soli]